MDHDPSQESEINRRFLTAWYAGDESALLDLVHPDLHFVGSAFETMTAADLLTKWRTCQSEGATFEITKELESPSDPWFYSEHVVSTDGLSTRMGARILLKEGRIASLYFYIIEYNSIEAARASSTAVLVVETEDLEEMLAFPLSQLAVDYAVVAALVADLENVLWRGGYQRSRTQECCSSIEFRPSSWYKPGSRMTAGLYLGPCIRRLGIESLVEDVLRGKRRRLDLPEGWPPIEVGSMAELRPFPRATVILYCGVRDCALLGCKATIVRATDHALQQLLLDLKGLLRKPIQSKNVPAHPKPSRVRYVTSAHAWESPRRDLDLLGSFEVRGLRQPILDVLQGRATRLQLTDATPQKSG